MEPYTLRRAAKLQSKIQNKLDELRSQVHETQHTVNVYDPNIFDSLRARELDYRKTYARLMALNEVLYDIRLQMGQVNAKAGVNDLLTHTAALTRQLHAARKATKATPRLTQEQIEARLKGATASANVTTYRQDTMILDVLSAETIEELKADHLRLMNRVDAIQDELERLNSSSTITLKEHHVSVLTAEGII